MNRFARFALLLSACAGLAAPAAAQLLPCSPCAGIETGDPYAALASLAAPPKLADDAILFVAYELQLDATANPAAAHALAGGGASPWLRLAFTTPAPLLEHLEELKAELDAAAAVARSRPARAHYQLLWRPRGQEGTSPSPSEYAFLVKRASVALTGEDPDAAVASQPLPPDAEWLRALYGQEIAAYLDLLAFAPAAEDALAGALATTSELDPGKPVVLDGAPWPGVAERSMSRAAAARAQGFALTLFRAPATLDAASLAPLKLLADEFRGELNLDSATAPSGGAAAWSFVRGEDLALRVLVETPPGADRMTLLFPDPQLRDPVWVPAGGGEPIPLLGSRRTREGLEVRIADPTPVVELRLDRASIAELEGVAEEVTIADQRRIPVEEILRRLQAFEDAQSRRIRHWQAVNTTTLRFQAASGVQAVEATFEGEIFYKPGRPFDWAWQRFYLNGVLWRGKSIPEIPLVQPEKAAAMPLEVLFTKEYRYALRGTEAVNGRDAWVVDFEPDAPVEGRTLFRGTVWVDRATSARLRTKAVQLGLTGEVLSNEETIDYSPVDADGAAAAWGGDAFVLPLRTIGQQILSVLNTATVVEKEVRLAGVVINGGAFDERREQVLASAATMVRDTDAGLRYLVPKEGGAPGEREVKEGFDTNKLFVLGGVFYDESLDYPLPLAGVNYFDLNFHGTEGQLNALFGGVLGIVNYADPHFLGSKIDLGVDVFGIAIASSDQLFRGGVESTAEEVKVLPGAVRLNFGFPLGSFVKVSTGYRLSYAKFSEGDQTDPTFILPSDNLTQRGELGIQLARGGYRLNLQAAFSHRSKWNFWGLPENTEYDPDHQNYATWSASLAKNWYLSSFRKVGLEVNYLDGRNLDRFSKYQFGFFGDTRVHGYQIGKVRAEKAWALHGTYGFEIGQLLRLDAVADAAWATDETSGLDDELLAGAGLSGTFMGPWETLVQLDVGTPLAGPDTGLVAYVVFLKLFK